jgi:hypothetical protein
MAAIIRTLTADTTTAPASSSFVTADNQTMTWTKVFFHLDFSTINSYILMWLLSE